MVGWMGLQRLLLITRVDGDFGVLVDVGLGEHCGDEMIRGIGYLDRRVGA